MPSRSTVSRPPGSIEPSQGTKSAAFPHSPVDGLGDRAAVHGGPPPNAVTLVVGDTFVELIVNDGELAGARKLSNL